MSFWSDPITFLSLWLQGVFINWGMAADLAKTLVTLLGAVLLPVIAIMWVIFLIWYERKIIGRVQDRFGPNRAGPFGIFQPFADLVKIFTKEYITPDGVDKVPYNLAPIIMVASTMFMWAVIPFTTKTVGANINVGALYLIAVGGIGELGVILAGYSSHNKFALLATFRVVAQLVSYEVPMVLALLVPVLLNSSMNLNDIVNGQPICNLLIAPLAAIIFFITGIAEVGRSPFDLLEADSELVAGFNIEYSGLKFGMFYVGDFMHAFTSAMIFTTLFLGGWRGPGAEATPILGFIYFGIKTFIIYFLTVLIRSTLPRFRIDQVMDFNWKVLTPLALVVLMVTALMEKLLVGATPGIHLAGHLVANLLILAVFILLYQRPNTERQAKMDALGETNREMAKHIMGE